MTDNVWNDVPDWGGVGARRLERGVTGLGASVWEFQPGSTQLVYHFHHGSDELLIVLRGTPTVHMHDGDHVLRETSSRSRTGSRAVTRSGTTGRRLPAW